MKQIIFVLVSVCFFKTACSIWCYECVSLNQQWCADHFIGNDVSNFKGYLVNCSTNCMTLTAHVDEKRKFYVRTCDVTAGLPSICTTKSQVLGIPVSTVCVCDTDACNKARFTRTRSLLLVTICALLIALIFII